MNFYSHHVFFLIVNSVTETISKSIIALTAKEGAHIHDLLISSKDDPEWLEIIRKKEVRIIQRWLERYYSDVASN